MPTKSSQSPAQALKGFKTKKRAYWKGIFAESLAEIFLRLKGYRFLERRHKTPFGEIDLVMKKGKILVAVEVKARSTQDAALESLTSHQQNRVVKSLRLFQVRHRIYHSCSLRFDFILLAGLKMCHIKGAWRS